MKKIDLLNSSFSKKSLNEMHSIYLDSIELLRDDVNEDYSNEHISLEFQSFFKKAIFSKKLDTYSPLNWYWYQLIDRIICIIGLHEDLVVSEEFTLTESEDAIFNFWNETDYAKNFLEMINETKDLRQTSSFHLRLLEQQLIAFFVLHIDFIPNTNSTYYNIPEIGDGEKRLYSYRLKQYLDTTIFKDGHICQITSDEKSVFVDGVKLEGTSFVIKDGFFNLISSSLEMDLLKDDFHKRILSASKIIETVSPALYGVLTSFTKAIVPINESGVVSYSMQSLPDYSCINMYDRDFVDLIDDLLHENGHHFLNALLNAEELIIEDDEKIYYSPWRRALRPIRGIYHAYLTFYWAYELFVNISEYITSKGDKLGLTASEIDKVYSRCLEEYYMLEYCTNDLDSAYREGKITPEGYQIIQATTMRIRQKNEFILKLKSKLTPESLEKQTELEEHLITTKKHYQLS